ncbi:hypothetical protein OAV27_01150 [Euryarchaeota archaeon]|nr:hypothetical protein [Euryarchaeota archaeon]
MARKSDFVGSGRKAEKYSNNITSLEDMVSALIEQGWVPKGGVSFANGEYQQAMVKP